jgi:hypothetical protein
MILCSLGNKGGLSQNLLGNEPLLQKPNLKNETQIDLGAWIKVAQTMQA